MQALGATQHRGQRLVGHAHDVVQRLLRGQCDAPGLGMEAHHLRSRIPRRIALANEMSPEPPRGAELRDLLEEIRMGGEEKAHPRRDLIDAQSRGKRRLDVCQSVGDVKAISCAAEEPASRMW